MSVITERRQSLCLRVQAFMENYCSGQLSVPAGTKRKKGGADGGEVAALCSFCPK